MGEDRVYIILKMSWGKANDNLRIASQIKTNAHTTNLVIPFLEIFPIDILTYV